jgi:hypothetical protein
MLAMIEKRKEHSMDQTSHVHYEVSLRAQYVIHLCRHSLWYVTRYLVRGMLDSEPGLWPVVQDLSWLS